MTLYESINIPEAIKPYVSNVKINVFEIAYLSDEQLSCFHSDFRIVADYFVQMQRNGDYVPSKEQIRHVEAVLQLLRVMTGDATYEDYLNSEDGLTTKGDIRTMDDFLNRVAARNKAIGAINEAIRIYHDEMNLLPSDIVKKIMVRFSLEQSEAEKYVEEALGLQTA